MQSGRVEIVEGFWVQNDEQLPHYTDMVHNAFMGHEWVLKNLGVIPKVGWQIDSFGHTATNSQIMAESGFSSWFTGRYRLVEKSNAKLARDGSFEHIWRPKYHL